MEEATEKAVKSRIETDSMVDPGLSVSPDRNWLYYGSADTFNSDIMLVENFR